MDKITFSLLRGVCQIPAYVAYEKGFFKEEGLDVDVSIEPTAWMVPYKLVSGESQFALIPWTRVAAAEEKDIPLVIICGSGFEEAAIVVRHEVPVTEVKKVAVPQRGGMKDLTAMGLIESLGWQEAELIRQPSGDGAIISLFGRGADAASMIEPYATMMEEQNIGRVVKRTGDIWPGAPGCSLATITQLKDTEPGLVQRVVNAFVRGANFLQDYPEECADIAAYYIGINARYIRHALHVNRPNPEAIRNKGAMDAVLSLMVKLGYIKKIPNDYIDVTFLDTVTANLTL